MNGSSRRIFWASRLAFLLAMLLVSHVCVGASESYPVAGHDARHGNGAEPREHGPAVHAASCYGIRSLVTDISVDVILVEVAPTTQAVWAPPNRLSPSRESIDLPGGPPLFRLYRAVLI